MGIRAALKSKQAKQITTAIILLLNIALWIVPSNVAYLIAQNRHVLLGRYSVDHLTALFFLIPISAMALYLTWSNEKNKKERKFKVIAISVSLIVSLIVMDIVARLMLPKRYVAEQTYFHRPPNTVKSGTSKDVPEEAFLYPRTPPGYPDIRYTLTIDKRGFRNKTDLEEYDVVILGDSFAEGSKVTDEHTWPALLAQKSKLAVYNLGMSAGHPGTYLQTLKKFALELSPKTVVCLLYEGNDFRGDNFRRKDTLSDQLADCFKESPIRNALKNLLIRCFGSTTANHPPAKTKADPNAAGENPAPNPTVQSKSPLSWLPVTLPDGPDGKYYTFKIKRLLEHFVTKKAFLSSKGARKTFDALRQIKEICSEKNIRLIIAYAPDKPHVLLPLITEIVSPEQLHAFMALKERKLPPADKLLDTLLPRLNVQESAFREFCREESIEFISLTQPLRRAVANGSQVYFTYDQHWTPPGHEVVADAISRYMQSAGKP